MKNSFSYALKAIGAFFVVMAHAVFPHSLGAFVKMIAHFSVPLFFMYSGYFCARKPDAALVQAAKRVAKMALWTQLLYLAFYFALTYLSGWPWQTLVPEWFSPKAIAGLVALNEPLVAPHLWYLFALVYCYLLLLLMRRHGGPERWYRWIPVPIVIELVLDQGLLHMGIQLPNLVVRNVWLIGMPSFLFGYMMRHHEQSVLERSWTRSRNLCIMIALGLLLLPLERKFSGSTCELYVGSMMISVSLLLLSLRHPTVLSGSWLESVGVNHSLFIYLYHIIVLELLEWWARTLGIKDMDIFRYPKPLVSLALIIAISYLVRAIRARVKPASGANLGM